MRRILSPRSNPVAFAVLIGIAFLFGVQALRIAIGAAPPLDGTLDGADSYMRLVRVLECHGRCPGGLVLRSNAPFGEVLHWPFLEDWLLLGIAAPLRLVLPFRQAVVVAGYLWGPLLSILLVIGLVRIAARLVPTEFLWLVGLLLPTGLWVLLGFAPPAVDHHGFMALLFVLAVAAALPALSGEEDTGRAAVWTGIAVGVGMWESIEVLAAAVPLVGALGVQWIVRGRPGLARFHRTLFAVATLVLVVALFIDGPKPHRFAAEYDRLSIVHVLLFALVTTFWVGAAAVPSRTALRRALLAALGLVAVVGLTIVVFPAFARGPHALTAPELFPLWIECNHEFRPVLKHPVVMQVITLGPLLAVLPFCALRTARGAMSDRMLWGFLLAAYLWFGALAAFEQIRWTYYLHSLYPIALAALLAVLLKAARSLRPGVVVALAQVMMVVLFLLAPPLTFIVLGESTDARGQPVCGPANVAAALRATPHHSHDIVLASVFQGSRDPVPDRLRCRDRPVPQECRRHA